MFPLVVPKDPIIVPHPNDLASEHEKFKDGGTWFLQYGRWIIKNLYNCYSVPSSFTTTGAAPTPTSIVTGNGSSLGGGSLSIVDEMLSNYDYYYGNQPNGIFNHLTVDLNNNPLPNVFIKGQEIRSLVDHIVGKCITLIDPIEKNISCDSISENSLLKKKEVFEKIDLAAEIGDVLNELGAGEVKYNPAGGIDYSNPSEIKNAKEKIRLEYQNAGTVIARSAYYQNRMAEMFVASAKETAIANLTGMHFKEKDGQLSTEYLPGHSCIYDFSTWGEYGEGQTRGGFILPVTLEEILQEYKDLNPIMVDEIKAVLYGNEVNSSDWMEYYNAPFTNVKWWYNNQKWMSKATVYWITRCDTRYIKTTNKYGNKRVKKIDDYKKYYDPGIDASQLPAGTPMKNGYEIKGDSQVWKVHKAVILGNKWLLEYGYEPYQVRPFGDKRKPIIPILFLCQGKLAGYVKSIVSRLRPKQDELDAVRYRIREYTAQDLGKNYFIHGGKLGESLTTQNIVNDLKTFHITVVPPTGDPEIDKGGIEGLVKAVDMSNHDYITQYLTLKRDIEVEMKAIVNLTDISLGEQSTTIGKGVQENTIARSELSGLSLYSSLQEHWRRCIQYAANKSKLIMLDKEDKNVILPVSAKDVRLLKLTKEMRFEDLWCYLEENDSVAVADMATLKQALIAMAVNPTLEAAESIKNIMMILKNKTFTESIVQLEQYIDDKRRENQENQMLEMKTEQATLAQTQQSNQILAMQQQVADLTKKLAEINLKSSWEIKKEEVKAGLERDYKLDDAYIAQITDLIQKQLAMVNQPQQQEQIQV